MRLADDETLITLDHEVIRLLLSLRAAIRLERKHGGFDKIIRAVAAGDLTMIADVIRECADAPTLLPAFLDQLATLPLGQGFERIVAPIIAHVMAMAGYDADQTAKPSSGEQITRAEYHTKLFRIATGWLGWSPADAWDATPAEIVEAYQGRREMLGTIFGNGASDTSVDLQDHDQRRALNEIGNLNNNVMPVN